MKPNSFNRFEDNWKKNNFSKFYGKVGVISWFLFHLIWKNYVLYWDFDLKSWIVDFFTRFTREKTPQNNFSSQNFSVENNYFHAQSQGLVKNYPNHWTIIPKKKNNLNAGLIFYSTVLPWFTRLLWQIKNRVNQNSHYTSHSMDKIIVKKMSKKFL